MFIPDHNSKIGEQPASTNSQMWLNQYKTQQCYIHLFFIIALLCSPFIDGAIQP